MRRYHGNLTVSIDPGLDITTPNHELVVPNYGIDFQGQQYVDRAVTEKSSSRVTDASTRMIRQPLACPSLHLPTCWLTKTMNNSRPGRASSQLSKTLLPLLRTFVIPRTPQRPHSLHYHLLAQLQTRSRRA